MDSPPRRRWSVTGMQTFSTRRALLCCCTITEALARVVASRANRSTPGFRPEGIGTRFRLRGHPTALIRLALLFRESISSGAALVAAALDDRVAALIVQVPALGEELPPDDPDGTHRESMTEMVRSGSIEPADDEIVGPIPVVWDDQDRRPSALNPGTAFQWFTAYGNRPGTNWVNKVTLVRPRRPVPWNPGLCGKDITCPAMFVVAPDDEMPRANPAVARDAYERLVGRKEWVEIPGGHFGLLYHPSEAFGQTSSAQSRFLTENLLSR